VALLAIAGFCAAAAVAAPTPGGPRLAFVRWDLSPERFELETVDRSGGLPLRLAGGGLRRRPLPDLFDAPSWSPDGSRIAFVGKNRSIEAGPRGSRVYVVGSDGKGLRPIRGTRGAFHPVFTPDGGAIAFTRSRRRGASIWLADLAGGTRKRITAARRDLYMLPGSFSPDGSTLLAGRFVVGRWEEVVAVRLDTGEIDPVLRRASEPVFSPDGTRFASIRWRPMRRRDGTRTVQSDIYTARASGSGLRRVTKTPFRDEAYPSWDPSGERLAFVRHLPEAQRANDLIELGVGSALMQMNADGTCPRQVLAPDFAGIYGAAWQPGPGREAGRIAC
jgi:Tol biopolymer transport system component